MPIGPGPVFGRDPNFKASKPAPRRGDEPKPVGRRRQPISPASPAQREAVRDRACIVCRQGPCDPAHVVDRSLGGADEPEAVVPLCRKHHREYDDERTLDLLSFLEPHHREQQIYAVSVLGIARAYDRLTNTKTVRPRAGEERSDAA